MSQIERKLAAVFLVFAAILVNQFSFLLAVAVLVVAFLIHRGFQMSDLKVNVQNPNRAQTLVSALYSWTETAVSAVARKCKRLAVSENRLPAQSFNNPRKSAIHQDYRSDSENIVYNRESIYQGSDITQGRRISYKFQEKTNPYTSANSPEWQRKSSSPSALNLNETYNSVNRRGSEKDNFSHRGSPWGYSLSPQQRNTAADVRPVQAVAGPLLASSRYNSNRDSALYVDVNSPGFGTRLLNYHSEAAIHQPQYARPGQLPLVHLNASPLPTLSPRNSRKVRAPVRVRIAPPSYDVSESRLFSRSDNQQTPERQSKSVVDVLKEISRKRIHTEDGGNEPKRHHRSDSSSSSSSSSSPALANGIITDQTLTPEICFENPYSSSCTVGCKSLPTSRICGHHGIPSRTRDEVGGKRPREEDSPKLQKQTCKRTRNNEIYSSLSSSRNLCVGTKRKAADNWSRCSTPSPLGKHLKKSPHPVPTLATETEEFKSPEQLSRKQQESLPQIKQTHEKIDKGAVSRNSLSPPYQEPPIVDAQPSSSTPEEHFNEENLSNKNQLPKSHHGRLFVKSFSRGIANEHENMKDVRRNGGTKPWKTRTTVDVDTITGEDIVRQDFDLGSRRLNSMFSVLQSSALTSMDSSKADVVDGPTPTLGSSKPSNSELEAKLDTLAAKAEDKIIDSTASNQADKSFPAPVTSISEVTSPKPVSTVSEAASAKQEQIIVSTAVAPSVPIITFGSLQSPSPKPVPLMAMKDKQASAESLEKPPITSTPSVNSPSLASPANSAIFSMPQPTPVPVTSQNILTTASTASVPLHSSTPLTAPSGTFTSVSTAPFAASQNTEKAPVLTTPSFSFGTSSIPNVTSPLAPKSGFTMPTSVATTTSGAASVSQPTVGSHFTILGSTPVATSSSSVIATKPEAAPSVSGGFSFGGMPAVTTSPSEFSILKTTSSVTTFGVSSPPTSAVATLPSTITSLPSVTALTSANSDLLASKSTFSFGTPAITSAPATTTTTSGGFSFQFGAGTQSTLAAPKLQYAGGGFKFSFGANKESTPLNQSSEPLAKPPAFGEGFTFGATPGANSQESKPMTFGTPTSLTPTLAAPAPSAGGFNFSANGSAGANLPKPSFGFGTANPSTATSPPLGAPLSGGFSFGAKPSEPAPVAPAAPNLATPFQFGSSSTAMSAASALQPQQPQAMENPFSLGGAAEQKPSILGGGFSFGSAPSASMPTLQSNVPAFGQPSVPTFGAPTVNPLQSPPPSNPSLFQFGSGGGTMSQPGMSSGGFNFGAAPATGVPSAGFNFNPSGPSATTPFQFGATPLQAPAMFSIGSGSTAPRSRPRNRRQK